MNIYYTITIIAFMVYSFGFFARASQQKKEHYTAYEAATALAALGMCTYTTLLSAVKTGVYAPLWFEDFLLLDLIVAMALVFTHTTRKMHLRELYFGVTAVIVSTLICLFLCELFLRSYFSSYLVENRIGQRYERRNEVDVGVMLYRPIPGKEKLKELHNKKEDLETAFRLRDYHIVPSPEKGKDEKRIVWLGDSMTEAAQVPWGKRFPQLLEKTTGIPHYVLAVGSTSSDFARVMIGKFFDVFQPDVVLLGFYPLNDYDEFGRQFADCDFAPLFLPDGNSFRYNCGKKPKSLYTGIYTQPANMLFYYAAYHTVLGNILMDTRRNLYIKIAKEFYYKPNPFQNEREFRPPYAGNSDAVCSMIHEINRVVTARGAVFGVVMMPYVLEDERIANYKNDGFYPPAFWGDKFLSCMKHSSIPFFNLDGSFDKNMLNITSKETIFFLNQHMNEKGNEGAAKRLLPFERELLERAGSARRKKIR